MNTKLQNCQVIIYLLIKSDIVKIFYSQDICSEHVSIQKECDNFPFMQQLRNKVCLCGYNVVVVETVLL